MSRYNLTSQSRGDHATLIANWVEERALLTTTGVTRNEPLALEGIIPSTTHSRIISHSQCETSNFPTETNSNISYHLHDCKNYSSMNKIHNIAKWNETTRNKRFSESQIIEPIENNFETNYQRNYKNIPGHTNNNNSSSFFPTLYQSNPMASQRDRVIRSPESFLQ